LERVKHYVARFDNSEKFGQYMWLEACKCGFEGQFTKWRMGAIMGREAFVGLKIHLQTTDAPYRGFLAKKTLDYRAIIRYNDWVVMG